MTTSTTGNPATGRDAVLQEHCESYQTEHGLNAVVDPARHRIVLLVAGIIGAVTMPAGLGRQVLAGLRVRMLAGPVIDRPTTARWTFITGPGHELGQTASAELLRLRVSVALVGDELALPSAEDDELGLLRWENPPSRNDFPPQSAVIATTRAIAFRR